MPDQAFMRCVHIIVDVIWGQSMLELLLTHLVTMYEPGISHPAIWKLLRK